MRRFTDEPSDKKRRLLVTSGRAMKGKQGCGKKLLYVAMAPNFLVANDIQLFEKAGYSVVAVLNTFKQGNPFDGVETLSSFRRIINLYEGSGLHRLWVDKGFPFSKVIEGSIGALKQRIRHVLRDLPPVDFVYCSWDDGVIPEAIAIKKVFPNVPIIFKFLMYPSSLSHYVVALENYYNRRKVPIFDGRIFVSQEMYHYMERTFDLHAHGKNLIFMQYLSESYFHKQRLPRLSDNNGEPHLVFTGQSDFRWFPENDVRQPIEEIADKGIHVHLATPNLPMMESRFIHFFSRIAPGPQFADFLTQFDGVIVLYNLSKKLCTDRLNNVFPNRFIWALTAGIPIFLASGQLRACEAFVKQHGIGFTFDTAEALKLLLKDRARMSEARQNAQQKRRNFTYENNFHTLGDFIEEVCHSAR